MFRVSVDLAFPYKWMETLEIKGELKTLIQSYDWICYIDMIHGHYLFNVVSNLVIIMNTPT